MCTTVPRLALWYMISTQPMVAIAIIIIEDFKVKQWPKILVFESLRGIV